MYISKTKTNSDIKLKRFRLLDGHYFQHHIDYDYTNTGCLGECYDTYCRCSKIINIKINSVRYNYIYHSLTKHNDIKDIKDYCLDRALSRLISIDNVIGYGEQGYYGEEFRAELDRDVTDKVNKYLEFLEKATTTDTVAIEDVLVREYGYVLDDLKDKTWIIEPVPIENIDIGGKDHYRKLDSKAIEAYKNERYDLTCLCIKMPLNLYRLIDGYHRFAAAKQMNKKKIKVVYCT